ncbi:MAG: C39 family peptidase [Bacteroidales bacterium]|nr:C39 family peptidase [Bacteroidales bacterium]MCM1415146.1 C39 family peptidase [bacterium]MCM1423018.1 C39 family peptidase [bacterium]
MEYGRIIPLKQRVDYRVWDEAVKNLGIQIVILESKEDINELQKMTVIFNKMWMETLFSVLQFPITIVYEQSYVDKLFRDSYYTYFSSKHFEMDRTCERITLFEGNFTYKDFLNDGLFDTLQGAMIGTIVLRPTRINAIGRTLLNPEKMHIGKMYVQRARFEICLLGKIYTIWAYPFTSQDTETMSCAETSIWTMLEYYGTRYSEYRTVLPSEILSELGNLSEERVLPSHGLDFRQKSGLLKKFGFHPRTYSKQIYGDGFRKLFHYYVESGIPITLSLPGHSVVCVGHAAEEYDITNAAPVIVHDLNYIDSSVFIRKYVIIDDNNIPYSIDEYDHFSVFDREMHLFTVPLYKRIFFEANDAATVFDFLLEKISPLIQWYISAFSLYYENTKNPLVKRIFLTSSRKFKKIRVTDASSFETRKFYSEILMPKFIWVCEIATYENYQNRRMLGEIVLDATAARYDHINSTLLIRIGDIVGYRCPDETFTVLAERLKYRTEGLDIEFKLYENNLKEVM